MTKLTLNRGTLLAFVVVIAAVLWIAIGPDANRSPAVTYNVPEVELPQAKALIDAGALVIDVRYQEQYVSRHLAGAVLVPLEILRAGVPVWLAAAKDKPVVVYCNEGLGHGPEATHILQQAGFTNVVNMRSGIEGWTASGLPVDKG